MTVSIYSYIHYSCVLLTLNISRSDLGRTENWEMVMKFGRMIKCKKGVFEYTAFMGELVTAYKLLVGQLYW